MGKICVKILLFFFTFFLVIDLRVDDTIEKGVLQARVNGGDWGYVCDDEFVSFIITCFFSCQRKNDSF